VKRQGDTKDDPSFVSAATIRSDPSALDRTVPAASSRRSAQLLGRRYEVLEQLGRGAEGAVYKVRDRHADELVALKILENLHEDSDELARLRRELGNARRITHPGIVRIYDLVEVDDRWALSMQLVEGRSLEDRIARGDPFSADELRGLARDLAEALAAAHAAGVTHRDLKPANILLHPDGRPVISDFGISRAQTAQERIAPSARDGGVQATQQGMIVGTPLYMAPEQLAAEPATPAVDVYALGLILNEAATGQVPLQSDSIAALRELRRASDPPSLAEARPDLEPGFCGLVDRCVRNDPSLRFRSGAEVVKALDALDRAEASPRSRARVPESKRHGAASVRRWAAVAGLAATMAITAVAALVVSRTSEPSGANLARVGESTDGRPVQGSGAAGADGSAAPAAPGLVFRPRNHRRVSFGESCDEYPAFMPDDATLVFDRTVGDRSHLFSLDLRNGAITQLTTSPGWDFAAAVSPDGKHVAFLRFDANRRGMWQLDLESKLTRLLVEGPVRPGYTVDGRHVLGGEHATPVRIDAETGEIVEQLELPSGWSAWKLLGLPDQRLAALFAPRVQGGFAGVALSSGAPGERRWEHAFKSDVEEAVALMPGGSHLAFAHITPTRTELVAIPLAGGPTVNLSESGISPGKGLAFSHGGKLVAWSTCVDRSSLVAFDANPLPPELSSYGDHDLAALPDGKLVLLSERDGTRRPWIVDPSRRESPRVVYLDETVVEVDASAKGDRIVVVTSTGLKLEELEGDAATAQLTTNASDHAPAFRLGDTEVLFTRQTPEGSKIMSVSTAGGQPTDLGVTGFQAVPIAGTRDFVYVEKAAGAARIMVWNDAAGIAKPLSAAMPPGRYDRPSTSRDGKLVAVAHRGIEVLVVELATGRVVRRETHGGNQLDRPVFDSKGRLFASRTHWVGALWVADLGD
jgi:tRNA A-37 threonylcarbamoyl transferase component Bud32/dipeptidyl aminopeptidase/acylaminoacyl peptidase